jgi:AcrR family transcriptional regulator
MPRAGLSTERVTAEAAALADEVGLDNLSLAVLATRVGVQVPSLYKHIDGLDALRQLLAVSAREDLADALGSAAIGKAGGDAVDAVAAAYRRWAAQHPGRYSAIQRVPNADDTRDATAGERAVRVIFDVLAGYGLTGDDAVDATRALRAGMHGFVSLEAAGGFGMPVDVDRSYERLIAGLKRALSTWVA